MVATTILLTFAFVAVAAPVISPFPVNEQNIAERLAPPSSTHPLGTDSLGRDLLTRLMYGARISLSVGLIAVGVAAAIGVPLGLISGFLGGWRDDVIMRFVDAWIAFPNLILVIGLVAVLGPGVVNVMIAIGLNSFPVYARLIRGQTLSVKERDFVLAARALGASNLGSSSDTSCRTRFSRWSCRGHCSSARPCWPRQACRSLASASSRRNLPGA